MNEPQFTNIYNSDHSDIVIGVVFGSFCTLQPHVGSNFQVIYAISRSERSDLVKRVSLR